MYNSTRLYDLSFVSPQRRPRTNPKFIFTVRKEYLEEINSRLHIQSQYLTEHAEMYIGEPTTFSHLTPDLFGHIEFGYGRCGFVTYENTKARICFDLQGGTRLRCSTLTIHLLTRALLVPIDVDGTISNREQQLDIETLCDHNRDGYGHALGGYVSSELLSWMHKLAVESSEEELYVPMPDEVVKAMREAWYATSSKDLKKYAGWCTGRIYKDGRFILDCFGDACDVAIYPEALNYGSGHSSAQFGCHNLDTAPQQITLMSGLAKMCELARDDEQH